jgi:hypothetical protein
VRYRVKGSDMSKRKQQVQEEEVAGQHVWPWPQEPDYQPSPRVRKLSVVGAWYDQRSGWFWLKYARRWMSPAEHETSLVDCLERRDRLRRQTEIRVRNGGLFRVKDRALATGDFSVLRQGCGIPASTSDQTIRGALLNHPLEDFEAITGASY